MDSLKLILILLFVLGLTLATIPFVKSMNPSARAYNQSIVNIDISNLESGEYKFVIWRKYPVVIYKTDPKTIKRLQQFNDQVWGPRITKETAKEYYVYKLLSTYKGCRLINHGSIEGAWFDPCHMGAWDYAGRALKGVNAPEDVRLANLESVNFKMLNNSVLQIKLWPL